MTNCFKIILFLLQLHLLLRRFLGNAARPGLSDIKVAYLQNGVPIVANDRGIAIGAFNDATPGLLNGDNGIVGRSIVLHSPVDGSKVAQGVIGLSNKYVR